MSIKIKYKDIKINNHRFRYSIAKVRYFKIVVYYY